MRASMTGMEQSLRFLGKVQFTMVLLLAGAATMIAGTILESLQGRDAAWAWIYGALWFDLYLCAIGVNLVMAVVNRLPIRRHQWAFVLTHVAIVGLLLGALISRSVGYEGRMVIREGAGSDEIWLDTDQVSLRWTPAGSDVAVDELFPLPRIPSRDLALRPGTDGGPGLRVVAYEARGMAGARMQPDANAETPGIDVRITGRGAEIERWLIADHERFGTTQVGTLTVEFIRVPSKQFLAGRPPARETGMELHVQAGEHEAPVHIPLPARLGQEVRVGPDVVVRVRDHLLHAQVVEGTVREVPAAAWNPAAVVEIQSGGQTLTRTVFSQFADFEGAHAATAASPPELQLSLHAPPDDSRPVLTIAQDAAGGLHLQGSTASARALPVSVQVGHSLALGQFGLNLEISRLVAGARPELVVLPAAPDAAEARPFVRVEASLNGERRNWWVERGGEARGELGGQVLTIAFGPAKRAVPFQLALSEFQLIHHPGSQRAAEYRSLVAVTVPGEPAAQRDAVISMNRPLDVAGFRVFQSSYQLGGEGVPDATVLTVSYDPGVPVVYVSFLFITIGVAWYMLRGGQARRAPAPRAVTARAIAPAQGAALAPVALLLALLGLGAAGNASAEPAVRVPVDGTRSWAILADGRVKPLAVYARETALAITGRESLLGLNSLELIWAFALTPEDFRNQPAIRVESPDLKTRIGVDVEQRRFSFMELMGNPRLQALVEPALRREGEGGRLDPLERSALETYRRLERSAGLLRGEALTVVPLPDENGSWLSPARLADSSDPGRAAIFAGYAQLGEAYRASDRQAFREAAGALGEALRAVNPSLYPPRSALDRELSYQRLNAFGKAWKLYLAGLLVLLLLGRSVGPWAYRAGLALILTGFACHSVGVGLRWVIAGRAPIADMYESLVFMGWGAIAFGLVAEVISRRRLFAPLAGALGFLCLAFAENLPIESAIHPLMPVLAHTSWLAVHVMTIMLSYSALALAMALGHVILFQWLFVTDARAQTRVLSQLLYKMLQVGLLFLVAGIIFGAVWANESWGRYWGWDPKETWSLITFFVYLAIVHARFAGWLHEFGLAAASILGFLSVIMTYYGVNFILAAGLHSYGFAEGGQVYVYVYALFEIGVILVAFLRYRIGVNPPVMSAESPGH